MKNKFLRFIIIIVAVGAALLTLRETYLWYYKTPVARQELANKSPKTLEEIRDAILGNIEDLRQIINSPDKYLVKANDVIYLDITTETQDFILDMSIDRIKKLIKETRPTLNDARVSEEAEKFFNVQKEAKQKIDYLNEIKKIKSVKAHAIKLGLDLAGGIHIVLGVDIDKLKEKLLVQYRDEWKRNLTYLKKEPAWKDKNEDEIIAEAKRRGAEFVENRINEETRDAADRAKQVIQNRIDQFGVSEVTIRLGPNNTLIIELPGANDVSAAEEILTRTGNLSMQIVNEDFMRNIPYTYKGLQEHVDDRYIVKMDLIRKLRLLFKKANQNPSQAVTITLTNPETRQTQELTIPADSDIYDVQVRDQFGLPKNIGATVLYRKVLLEGNLISDAYVNYQRNIANEPVVDFQLNSEGAELFAKITRENKGKPLAILLDNNVKSAPVIREEIPGGRGQISGNFTAQEASFLSGILKAGALKVPLKIEELRVVGPSLGKDQIETGIRASLIALLVVVVFMIGYYRLSGFYADIALIFNVTFAVAILASLGLTLTLPGIAGFVLTLGMAVDANVIINERIKEEIRDGRSVSAALEAGHSKAFRTIADSNITTIMAALVISQVGTGPIRGFGVTLFVGILVSMFTALFVVRFFEDCTVKWFKVKKISVFPIFVKYPEVKK